MARRFCVACGVQLSGGFETDGAGVAASGLCGACFDAAEEAHERAERARWATSPPVVVIDAAPIRATPGTEAPSAYLAEPDGEEDPEDDPTPPRRQVRDDPPAILARTEELVKILKPTTWVRFAWHAWLGEPVTAWPCPACDAAPGSACQAFVPAALGARWCREMGAHGARLILRAECQPPHSPWDDLTNSNGSELCARSRGFLPYPPGTTYTGHYPAVIGCAVVRSREEHLTVMGYADENDRLRSGKAPLCVGLDPDVPPAVGEAEPARARQATLGAWA